MSSVKNIKDCYGCGVCATVCSKNAISIKLNSDGFYNPSLDLGLCTNCGLCAEVCGFLHEDLALNERPKYAYGAWSNNPIVRKRCSSGGIGYEIGKYLLEVGYKLCGVRYNIEKHIAEHYIATDQEQWMFSVGSKYIQSYTVNAFKLINRREKYLVTGTPCQIDSFRRYIRKFNVEENFILMDFFCHCVPSILAWRKYLQMVEDKIGPISYVSWRNKFTGWHDSWAMAMDSITTNNDAKYNFYNLNSDEQDHQYNSRLSQGDLFYKLFLGDYCANPACRKNCKYKYNKSSADIRIGDFWGATYSKNEEGVSAVVAYTEKGNNILKHIDCSIVPYEFEVVAEGQMKENIKKAYTTRLIYAALKSSISAEFIYRIIFKLERLCKLFKKIIANIKKFLCAKK